MSASALELDALDYLAPSLEAEVDAEIYKRSFRDYIPDAFEVVEGGEEHAGLVRLGRAAPRYTPGWHLDAIADHLQAVANGEIKRLLINVPPGSSKSMIACVLWPTWLWAVNPALRFLFSSYSEAFTKRDARKSRALMGSGWYQRCFATRIAPEPDTALEQHTTAGGERHGAATNSGVTGKHVNGIVEDDPLKAQDGSSKTARDAAWEYRTETLGFRLLPRAWRVVIMQRLHEDDPSGRILARQGRDAEEDVEAYVHLCLPMEFEGRRRCSTSIGFVDPRKEEGELLWPQRLGPEELKPIRSELGEYGWAGQGQQRPAPAGGGLIKRDWIRFYRPGDLPARFDAVEQSWDLIFTGDGVGSFVVGQIWGRKGANHYLLHQYRERVDFVGTLRAFVAVSQNTWCVNAGGVVRKKVERKANGAALVAVVQSKIPGVVAWPPKGEPMPSKAARTEAIAPIFESGNVYVPDPAIAPWVESWIEEVVGMTPNGPSTSNDDQVDTTTQYLADKGSMTKTPAIFEIDLEVGTRPSSFRGIGGDGG